MAPKPLVFVPGLPGTVIREAATGQELFPSLLALLSKSMRPELLDKLSGPDDPDADDGIVAGDPIGSLIKFLKSSFIDFSGTLKQADSLYDILKGFGYSQFTRPFGNRFRPIGWDWRRPVDQARAQADVRGAITALHQATGEPVTVLCHSTGGLVVRSLLEGEPTLADSLERLIAIGVPWAGTLQPLPILAAQAGFGPLTNAQSQHILGHSWAAFDLLPPDPAKTDMTDDEGDLDFFTDGPGQTSPLVRTGWISPATAFMRARAARSDARFGRKRSLDLGGRRLPVINLAGWGEDTLTGCRLDSQGHLTFQSSPEGDGTVPRRSASWLAGQDVQTFVVPVGNTTDSQIERLHIALWENRAAQDLLGSLLAGRPRPPYTYAAVDAGDAINNVPQVRVRVVAQDQNGQPLPGAYAQALGLNPPNLDQTRYPINNGRAILPLRRENIGQKAQGGWWRFEVQIHWQEGGQDKSGPRQALLVQKPG